MPHQCLKCGKVFPSGSMEIFKGCSSCKGKRFFYTEKPVSENERKELTERANKDMKELVRDLLTERRGPTFTQETGKDADSGWVKIDKDGKMEAVSEETIRQTDIQMTGKTQDGTIDDSFDRKSGSGDIKSKLQQILDGDLGKPPMERPKLEEKKEKVTVIPKDTKPEEVPEESVPTKTTEGKEAKTEVAPRGKKGRKKGTRRKFVKKPPSKKEPEVITVVEPGVYELDLERLMDHSPIIILKDGTYLLHLPSLFSSKERK
jgi:predicted  nucleic acid-binding Zn-ribbon protein